MMDPGMEIKTITKTTWGGLSWDDLHRLNQMSCCSSNTFNGNRHTQTPLLLMKTFHYHAVPNQYAVIFLLSGKLWSTIDATSKSAIKVAHLTDVLHFSEVGLGDLVILSLESCIMPQYKISATPATDATWKTIDMDFCRLSVPKCRLISKTD